VPIIIMNSTDISSEVESVFPEDIGNPPVQKVTPSASTVFHYDCGGRLIAETTGDAVTDYVYLDELPVTVLK
jgi:hypothetical protein